jgi:putative oxidoreductase
MPTFMTSFEPQAYALMRIVAGLLFIWHGTQKLLGFPGTPHEVPALSRPLPAPSSCSAACWS